MKAKKVAVISDLHASLSMLDAFISYINKQDVELILNLGIISVMGQIHAKYLIGFG